MFAYHVPLILALLPFRCSFITSKKSRGSRFRGTNAARCEILTLTHPAARLIWSLCPNRAKGQLAAKCLYSMSSGPYSIEEQTQLAAKTLHSWTLLPESSGPSALNEKDVQLAAIFKQPYRGTLLPLSCALTTVWFSFYFVCFSTASSSLCSHARR